MNSKFYVCNRNTMMIMPPTISEWLPDNHQAKFVVEIIDELDVSVIENKYARNGGQAYPVRMLLGLLFYGYITGTYSSRKIEKATYDSVAFRFIAANMHPDHDTIATFRKNFSGMLEGIFLQILKIAQAAGCLTLGNVSLDGSKILANASKHKALSWKHANKLEKLLMEEIVQLMEKAKQADQEEYKQEFDIPAELARRENRLTEIRRAKKEIEKRAKERGEREAQDYKEAMEKRAAKEAAGKKCKGKPPKEPSYEPKDTDQVNLVDEESRIMPKSGSKDFVQAYNAQVVVDQNSMLIIANHVTQHTNDKQEVEPALAGIKIAENALQEKCASMAGDTGYFSKENIQHCEDANLIPLIAENREKHNTWLKTQENLSDDTLSDEKIVNDADPVNRLRKRMRTREGRKIYAKRKSTVEPVFGSVKHNMGFRGFSRRTLKAASDEWNLVSIAWNLKRLFALMSKNCQTASC